MSIYIGTGGYSDTDLLGALYPQGTKKTEFLAEYAKHYTAVEINSSFYAPIGKKAFDGMLAKSDSKLKFAIKLHQDFTHNLTGTPEAAQAFIEAIASLIEAEVLACLLLQFPHGFDRTVANRHYLANLTQWFAGVPLSVEFRHQSWHTAQVYQSFVQQGLIWCSVDYPSVPGLPLSRLILTNRIGYLRLHGRNPNWWDAHSAAERHDYRYNKAEMQAWAVSIANQRQHFDDLYIFFENTVNAHAVYNIAMLTAALLEQNLEVAQVQGTSPPLF